MKNQTWKSSKLKDYYQFFKPAQFKKTAVLVVFLISSLAVHSQSLADFKYSSERSKGNTLIPYSNLRGAAKTLHNTQTTKRKAAEGYKSAPMLKDKKLYIDFKEDVERYLATAERNLSSDDGEDASKTAELKKEVKKHEDDLDEINDKLDDLNERMKDGIPKWEAVADARIRVREVFREVIDELADSKRYPEKHIGKEPDDEDKAAHDQWEEDKDDLEDYIDKIKSKINASFRTHDDEIEVAEEAVEKLKEGLRLR
ncbi:MAG: hypothetical protein P8P74_02410 [Crocinitomicaceae bacterium]|nr:hypothetical protein [Crocinitomicaceae bacterium]